MGQSGVFEVTIRVRSLDRSRPVYERLGFVQDGASSMHTCRLQRGGVVLVLSSRTEDGDGRRQDLPTRGPRGGGVTFTVFVPDFDEVLAYWTEEGMLVVSSAPDRQSSGRMFRGLDHDGYGLQIVESDSVGT